MKVFVLALAAALALAQPAAAWFDMGHMTIAAAAYGRLKPHARDEVARLLKLNPDFSQWTAGASDSMGEAAAFAHAATWADDIKRRPDYQRGTLIDDGGHASDNIGYADHRLHAYWHYIDLPFSVDGSPTVEPDAPNALTQIDAFAETLASDAPDELKSYDLVWLLHLVGDAHQPLHATSRFSRALPRGDTGGNQEKICRAFTCGMKLHAFWDGLLGDTGGPREAIEAAGRLDPPDSARAGIADPKIWIEESAALARGAVYTPAIGDGPGPFRLDDAYQAKALQIARAQAALAAARLANLLNAALAERGRP
jgi:hypothetical protein